MDLALVPLGDLAAPDLLDGALWSPETENTVREAHDQLATIFGPKTSGRLVVAENVGTSLAILGGILVGVLPFPMNQSMYVLMAVGMQLRIVSRIKKQTLEDAAEVVATFALMYHLVASKRHLSAYLQKNCVSTLNSMTATADRLMAWVKLAKTHNGVWGAVKQPFTKFEEDLYKIRNDVREIRANIQMASTLAIAELLLSAAASFRQPQQPPRRRSSEDRQPGGRRSRDFRRRTSFEEISSTGDLPAATGALSLHSRSSQLSKYGGVVIEECDAGSPSSNVSNYCSDDDFEKASMPSLTSRRTSSSSLSRKLSSFDSGNWTPTEAKPPSSWRAY